MKDDPAVNVKMKLKCEQEQTQSVLGNIASSMYVEQTELGRVGCKMSTGRNTEQRTSITDTSSGWLC